MQEYRVLVVDDDIPLIPILGRKGLIGGQFHLRDEDGAVFLSV